MSNGNGGGGSAPTARPRQNATERALELIRQSDGGLTAEELRADEVLGAMASSTVSTIPPNLRKRGLIESAGFKRDGYTVWRAVTNPVPVVAPSPAARKADKIVEGLRDPKIRDEVRAAIADGKGLRAALAALAAVERDLEAAHLAAEKREAAAERERLRLLEAARDSADTSIKTWEKLAAEVNAAWRVIAAYALIVDDLPAINPVFERTLGRELAELRRYLDRLEAKLYPGRQPGQERESVRAGTIIDVG
jgi:hypothetical protein